jgi:hypothetical protein
MADNFLVVAAQEGELQAAQRVPAHDNHIRIERDRHRQDRCGIWHTCVLGRVGSNWLSVLRTIFGKQDNDKQPISSPLYPI